MIQVPDFLNAKINGIPAKEVIKDTKWLETEFTERIQKVYMLHIRIVYFIFFTVILDYYNIINLKNYHFFVSMNREEVCLYKNGEGHQLLPLLYQLLMLWGPLLLLLRRVTGSHQGYFCQNITFYFVFFLDFANTSLIYIFKCHTNTGLHKWKSLWDSRRHSF